MISILGQKRHQAWSEYGFLVLPGFCDESALAAIDTADADAWASNRADVVVDDLVTNERLRLSDVSEGDRNHHFKVNDLFLTEPGLRNVVLSERLGAVLSELLEDEPAICNTLNFTKGSEQADHLDTLYMTPLSERALVATWIALEDAAETAGPLRYYPGSNHITPYRFKTGGYHVNLPEMPEWSDYMASQVDRMGLTEQRFCAQRGDVFIWSSHLLHGGCPIEDPTSSRRSIVTHYFAQRDCEQLGLDLRPAQGGWWAKRPHQPVPERVALAAPSATSGDDELHTRLQGLTDID